MKRSPLRVLSIQFAQSKIGKEDYYVHRREILTAIESGQPQTLVEIDDQPVRNLIPNRPILILSVLLMIAVLTLAYLVSNKVDQSAQENSSSTNTNRIVDTD